MRGVGNGWETKMDCGAGPVCGCGGDGGGLLCQAIPRYHSISATVGCAGESYREENGTGYLTVKPDGLGQSKTFPAEDETLKAKLAAGADRVIGISFSCDIPRRDIQEAHIDIDRADPFALLLQTDRYDDTLVLTGVHFDEAQTE